jgi:hypothetical protein
VAKIDQKKAIKFFGDTQGWTAAEVRQQVLTPLEEMSLIGSNVSDPNSIMCYQIPGNITKNGKPILGGKDIGKPDYEFMAKIYPVKAIRRTAKKKIAARKKKRSSETGDL